MLIFTHKKIIITITAVLTFFLGIAFAEAITLQEAKKEALRTNLNIKIAKEMILEKQSESKKELAAMFPKLSLESFASHSENKAAVSIEKGSYGTYYSFPFPQNDVEIETGKKDNLMIGLKLEQPVFTGGKLYYSYQMAKSRKEWSEWNDQQGVLDVIRKVEEAYLNVLKAEENEKFAEKHQTTLNAHLVDVEIQYRNGRVALHEVLKVKLEVARSKELITKAHNALLVAKIWLNTILNRPTDQPIEVTKVEEPLPIVITVEDAEKQALTNHPGLKRARTLSKEAMYNRRISEGDYYPNILLATEYFQRTAQPVYPDKNWYVMVTMSWPFWEWGKTSHKINASRSIERQLEYTVSDLENQIKAEIRQSWLQIKEADAQIEVAKEAVNYAEENLRITQVGYQKGFNTSTAVLQAEELLSQTYLDYIKATYDLRFAWINFRYAMGLMMETNIQEVTE